MTVDARRQHDRIARLVRRRFPMTIGGEHHDGGTMRDVIDPSTGQKIAEVPEASAADIDAAARSATEAQPGWAALPLARRVDALSCLSDLISDRRDDLAVLESIDTGNPLPSSDRDMMIALTNLREWPAMARTLTGRVLNVDDASVLSVVTYEPFGVVGRITAYNHPFLFALNGVLMSLLSGNTIVVKPSELAPLSTLVLGELCSEVFPPGVVNVVSGGGKTGAEMVAHRSIRRLSFVGAVSTGLAIQEGAARSGIVKRVSLELGGKNAMVVMPDADLDQVLDAAMRGMSLEISLGQSCQATSRVLVHKRLNDEFIARAADRMAAYRIGPAYEESSQLGPMISSRQRDLVEGYVELGKQEGARLVTGGGRPGGVPAGGWYLEPALFADVSPEMRIGREEVFGPLMCVLPWSDYETMVEIANGVDLGLSASVWSENIHMALATARRLQAGYVWVNDTNRHYLGAPYGGVKNSGVGREESVEELLSYLEVKSTHVRTAEPAGALAKVIADLS